jgi:putative hemolysin
MNPTVNIPQSRLATIVSPSSARYRVRLAASESDVRAAQTLRFIVFNLELSEGLESSYNTMLDADRFDAVCDHVLVEDAATQEVVGTYRLQTGETARRHHGYYSEQEFDFRPYEPLRGQMVELGRACIRADHRNFTVLNILWKAVARYAYERGAHWMVGCSSLTSQEPAVGSAAYRAMASSLVEPRLRTLPTARFACELVDDPAVTVKIPRLLHGYLALGARICGPPALDREFKTIDFLTLLDLNAVPERVLNRLLA